MFLNAGKISQTFLILVNFLKIVIPICLILTIGISKIVFYDKNSFKYCLYFCIFLAWIGFVSLINGHVSEWVKLPSRFIFFIAILSLFFKKPINIYEYFKILIFYVIFSLIQYISNYIFDGINQPREMYGYITAGINGLFSNISASVYLKNIDFPVQRLTGFWQEPSNASGIAFACFYLSKILYIEGFGKKWSYTSYICLLIGLLCFSSAGFVAITISTIFANILAYNTKNTFKAFGSILMLACTFFLLAIFLCGRLFPEVVNKSPAAQLIVGLRDESQYEDPFSKRLDLVESTIKAVQQNPFGLGMLPIEQNSQLVSASAFFYWLLVGGLVGIFLILLRELQVIQTLISSFRKDKRKKYLFQAFIVIMVQHLSYGSWMEPSYLVLAAAVLAFPKK